MQITVAAVRYTSLQLEREGVASNFLATGLQVRPWLGICAAACCGSKAALVRLRPATSLAQSSTGRSPARMLSSADDQQLAADSVAAGS